MNHKSELPPGWAMPDDQANNLLETLNKKPTSPVDVMEDALNEIAHDIALLEPNPHNWEGWVFCLLEQLEAEAQKRKKFNAYNEMGRSLIQVLSPNKNSSPQ